MSKMMRVALAAALAAAVLTQSGCVFRAVQNDVQESGTGSGETQNVDESVSLDGATDGKVTVSMDAGNLDIEGGAASGTLVEGSFDYYPDSFKPVFETDTDGDTKTVIVRNEARSDGDLFGLTKEGVKNDWDVRLTGEVPLVLEVNLGAGDSDVDLTEVDVNEVNLNMGAGDATIDLSGERTHDVNGTIQAGAGQITIKLPADVGVRVMGAQDGLGDWDAPGFTQDGNYYVNDAYETSDVKIELNVQRAVGQVRLELEN